MSELPKSLLLQELQRRNEASLITNLGCIRDRVAPILGRISNFFDDYTNHDVSHSDQVLANLDWIVPNSVIKAMNSYELYLLAMACYLHDVGMAVNDEDIAEIEGSAEFQSFKRDRKTADLDREDQEILKDYVRAVHHRRGEAYILRNCEGAQGLMINSPTFARAVSIIARGHREENLLDFDVFDPTYYVVSGREPVCLAFLACCLRLSDELDLTRERTPELLHNFVNPKNPISKDEWERHRSTLTVGLDGEKIKIQAACENPKIHKAIMESAKKIQNEIDLIQKVVLNLPQDLRDSHFIAVNGALQPKIESIGYLYREFQFEVDKAFVANTFMGDRLYPSRYDCLRELLQNSVDTCRLKSKIKASYVPQLRVGLSQDGSKLWIEDNGMDMNEFIIENFLMKVGRSYYRSYDYERQYGDLGLSPISEFGIGILSCFMIAESIVVETLMDGESPRRLEVESSLEDFVLGLGARHEVGTRIELNLRPLARAEINDDLLEERIGHYARHIEFPITLARQYGSEVDITDKGFTSTAERLLKPFDKEKAEQYEIVGEQIEPHESNGIRGELSMILEKGEKGYLVPGAHLYEDFEEGLYA